MESVVVEVVVEVDIKKININLKIIIYIIIYMNHQDWEKVVIHGKALHSTQQKKELAPKISNQAIQMKKIEESTEIGKLKELQLSDRQIMISMRAAKGLKQDQIAQALSMPANLYKDIENGKTIPTQQQLTKINNYLKINVKLS
jgi:ribosome-binding protein aMBF1 (putative translation factor)